MSVLLEYGVRLAVLCVAYLVIQSFEKADRYEHTYPSLTGIPSWALNFLHRSCSPTPPPLVNWLQHINFPVKTSTISYTDENIWYLSESCQSHLRFVHDTNLLAERIITLKHIERAFGRGQNIRTTQKDAILSLVCSSQIRHVETIVAHTISKTKAKGGGMRFVELLFCRARHGLWNRTSTFIRENERQRCSRKGDEDLKPLCMVVECSEPEDGRLCSGRDSDASEWLCGLTVASQRVNNRRCFSPQLRPQHHRVCL